MINTLKRGDTLLVVSQADLKELFLEWAEEWQQQQQQQQQPETYLSADEACAQLNVSKPTLWRWQKKKYLTPVKVGRRTLYRQLDITQLMSKEG